MGALIEITEGLPLFLGVGLLFAVIVSLFMSDSHAKGELLKYSVYGSSGLWFLTLASIHVFALHEDPTFFILLPVLIVVFFAAEYSKQQAKFVKPTVEFKTPEQLELLRKWFDAERFDLISKSERKYFEKERRLRKRLTNGGNESARAFW